MRNRNAKGQFARETGPLMYEGCVVYFDAKGYACIWRDGRDRKVHVLVWEKHNGPKPDGHEIHHRDEDKSNFALENLELLTRADHQRVHAGWRKNEMEEWIAKPCTSCGKILPLAEFYPRKGYTPSARCKQCHCEATKHWSARNPEKRKEISRRYWERRCARDGLQSS